MQRLKSLGADFKKTNRGGLITFHGPGQLVAYPVLNLKHFKTSVRWYVTNLEQTIIELCDELGKNNVTTILSFSLSSEIFTFIEPKMCRNLDPYLNLV